MTWELEAEARRLARRNARARAKLRDAAHQRAVTAAHAELARRYPYEYALILARHKAEGAP